jgi:hypothetical protein
VAISKTINRGFTLMIADKKLRDKPKKERHWDNNKIDQELDIDEIGKSP